MATFENPEIIPFPRRKKRRKAKVKCIHYPNRAKERLFTARDVGRLVCVVIGQQAVGIEGTTRADPVAIQLELRAQINKCLPCEEAQTNRTPTQQVVALAQSAAAAVQSNATIIAVAIAVLTALLVLPRLLPLLPRVALALLPSVARIAITAIPQTIARLRTQHAANDAFIKLVSGLR